MAKRESSFGNMVMALLIIAFAASACLGFVYELTRKPIELSALKKKLDAIQEVVPGFDNSPDEDMFRLPTGEGDSLDVYTARKDDEVIGYAVNTYSMMGFSGEINLMVGFKPDGTIINITVLQQKETPGLGTKMTGSLFREQFIEKDPSEFSLRVKKDGGSVDAITAATISSRAFCDAVQRAYNTLYEGGAVSAVSGSTLSSYLIHNIYPDINYTIEKGGP